MNIAILGAGKVGGNLLIKLSAHEHHIAIGTRDPNSEKIQDLLKYPNTSAFSHLEAIQKSDVVIISMHPPHVREMLPEIKDALAGKVVIDCMNQLFEEISDQYDSATHALAGLAGVEKIAKAFNTTGAENILKTEDGEIDTFIAGEDSAKKIATELATQIGFRPVDAGDITLAHSLEEMARVWVNVCRKSGKFDSYFKLIGL
jgi:predicted dinucleotide-binding enzyme